MKNKIIILFSIIFIVTAVYSLGNINSKMTVKASQDTDISAINHYYSGNYDKAINDYRNIIKKNQASESDLKNLAFIYKELGKIENSLAVYLRLLTQTNDRYYNYLVAKYNYQLANYRIANYHFQKLLDSENNLRYDLAEVEKSNFYYILANNYWELSDYKKAEEMFIKGINSQKNNSLNYLGLAKLNSSQNDFEKAAKYYKKVIDIDNNITQVYPALAESYDQLKNESSAYQYWKKSLVTGKNKDLAKKRIKELQNEYSYLNEKEKSEKKLKRENIEWMDIKEAPQNKNLKSIKIGIVDKVEQISFQTNKSFKIIDGKNIIIQGKANQEWSINRNHGKYEFYQKNKLVKKITTNNNLKIKSEKKKSIFIIYDITYGEGYFWAGSEDRQYRGNFELYTIDSKKFNLINKINLAEYLYSVVPAEMPALWPEEALKAQTIAARSYTLRHFGRHLDDGYNLCDSVHCAAYHGIKSEHEKTYNAVNETLKEAAYYKGKVIDAVFSSNCGGYCESSKDVWGNKHQYLNGVSTMTGKKYNFPLSPYKLNAWLKSSPPSYSKGELTFDNVYRWNKLVDIDFIKEKFDIDTLKDIMIKKRSKGGSVKTIQIIGIKNNKNKVFTTTIKGDYIRSSLGGLRSNRFILDKIYNKEGNIKKIIVYGAGWGHNVGMDQSAAATMAEKDFNYKEIIKFFYKNTQIKSYNE